MSLDVKQVHVWCIQDPVFIRDQLLFLEALLAEDRIVLTHGAQPRTDCTNILIEDFDLLTIHKVKKFRARNPAVSVFGLLTEHYDFINDKFFAYGKLAIEKHEYISNIRSMRRIQGILIIAAHLDCFLTLGDLPEIRGFDLLFPDHAIHRTRFPDLVRQSFSSKKEYDFLFAGNVTAFRSSVIQTIRELGYKVLIQDRRLTDTERKKNMGKVHAQLNIAQDSDWHWVSPMRVLHGWRNGLPTISFGTRETSLIGQCVQNIPLSSIYQIRDVMTSTPSSILDHQILKYDELKKKWNKDACNFRALLT